VAVDSPDLNVCVWRLFDANTTSEHHKLKYRILYDQAKSQNVEFVLFDFDLATNTSVILQEHEETGEILVDMAHLQTE
jgi:hypothetical protein